MKIRYVALRFGASWGLYDAQVQEVLFYGEAWDIKAEAVKMNKNLRTLPVSYGKAA